MARQGRYWQIDQAGYILNDAHADLIQETYKAVIDEAVQAFNEHIGADIHSIYVTGSVARGLAIEGESDLNMIAVLEYEVDPELVMQDWLGKAERNIRKRHACVSDVHMDIYPYGWLLRDETEFSISAFILKSQSVCVWGSDVSPDLGNYNLEDEKIRIAIANDDIIQLEDDINEAFDEIENDDSPQNVRYWCQWICKQILMVAASLVLVDTANYSRDLDLAYADFAQAFPQQAEHMQEALNFVDDPTAIPDEILHYLDSFGLWLIDTCDQWLEHYNPEREYEFHLAPDDDE